MLLKITRALIRGQSEHLSQLYRHTITERDNVMNEITSYFELCVDEKSLGRDHDFDNYLACRLQCVHLGKIRPNDSIFKYINKELFEFNITIMYALSFSEITYYPYIIDRIKRDIFTRPCNSVATIAVVLCNVISDYSDFDPTFVYTFLLQNMRNPSPEEFWALVKLLQAVVDYIPDSVLTHGDTVAIVVGTALREGRHGCRHYGVISHIVDGIYRRNVGAFDALVDHYGEEMAALALHCAKTVPDGGYGYLRDMRLQQHLPRDNTP